MTYGTTSCTESNGNPDRSRDGRRDGFSPVPIPNPARQAGAEPIDIRDAWAESAPALAAWTDKHLVNRRDAFGHYQAVESRTDPDLTAYTDKGELTQAVLKRHFRGESTGDLIGLHATVRDEPQAAIVPAPRDERDASDDLFPILSGAADEDEEVTWIA